MVIYKSGYLQITVIYKLVIYKLGYLHIRLFTN